MTDTRQKVLAAIARVLPVRDMLVLSPEEREALELGLGDRTRKLVAAVDRDGMGMVPSDPGAGAATSFPHTLLPAVAWFDQLGNAAIETLIAQRVSKPPPVPPPHPTLGQTLQQMPQPQKVQPMWGSFLEYQQFKTNSAGAVVFQTADSYLGQVQPGGEVRFALFVIWVTIHLGYDARNAKDAAIRGALIDRINSQVGTSLSEPWEGADPQLLHVRATAPAPPVEAVAVVAAQAPDAARERRRTGWALCTAAAAVVMMVIATLTLGMGQGVVAEINGALHRLGDSASEEGVRP